MIKFMKNSRFLLKLRKSRWYSRIRQFFPQDQPAYHNDADFVEQQNAKVITVDWPDGVKKPHVGLVRDFEIYPRWTKYVRFFENNNIPYSFYNIHSSDWIEESKKYDVIVGIPASFPYILEEMRRKYYFLEKYMGKSCYPSAEHTFLFEDKRMETYLSDIYGFPFTKTYISSDKDEALSLAETLDYPVIHKIDPSSGSMGTELIPNRAAYRKLVKQAFSPNGRKTHSVYFSQKNVIYLQELIPNDGYDIRVIIVGNQAFGYYRKTPKGDFRASGMDLVEKRSLPMEAVKIAYQLNCAIKSPQLVVDMVHGLDGQYYVIEYSPFCQMERASQLKVDGKAGVYIIDENENIQFEKGRYWVHELALKEYFTKDYIPKKIQGKESAMELDYACG